MTLHAARRRYKPGGWSYHEGDPSDPRMTAAAVKRGVRLTSRSRPLKPEDFKRFKYIIGMDPNNIRAILVRARGSHMQVGLRSLSAPLKCEVG